MPKRSREKAEVTALNGMKQFRSAGIEEDPMGSWVT
jgi:hypothetical protein